MRAHMWPAIVLGVYLSANTLVAQTAAPAIVSGGILNAASLAADSVNVAAPGSLVSIFGNNLATTTATASSAPLPQELNGTAVLVGNVFAPLLFISPTQINAQIPLETLSGTTVSVVVWVNGHASAPESLRVESAAPGIFTLSQNGVGSAAAFHADSSLVTSSSPAVPGEEISLLMTGLGTALASPSVPTLVSGANGNGQPTLLVPTATIGGSAAVVTASIAAPSGAGQYLVSLVVPIVSAGDQPIIVTIGGKATAAPVSIPTATSTQGGGGGFQFTQPPPLFQQTFLAGSFTARFSLNVKVPDPQDSNQEITEIAEFSKTINSPGCTINISGLNGPTYEALVHCQDYSDSNNLIAIIMGLKGGQFADNKLVFTTLQDTAINRFFFIGGSSRVAGSTDPSRQIGLTAEAPIVAGAASIDFKRQDFAAGDTIIGTLHVSLQFGGSGTVPSQSVGLGGGFVDTITFVQR